MSRAGRRLLLRKQLLLIATHYREHMGQKVARTLVLFLFLKGRGKISRRNETLATGYYFLEPRARERTGHLVAVTFLELAHIVT